MLTTAAVEQFLAEPNEPNRLRMLAAACPPPKLVPRDSVPHVLLMASRCECGAAYFSALCPCPATKWSGT